MVEIGLQTSSTGYPAGKTTGQSMTHYLLKDGPFQRACGQLQASGWTLNREFLDDPNSYKKSHSKIKIISSVCGMNLWGAPGCFSICTSLPKARVP